MIWGRTSALDDPRRTTPEAAEALIASARPIYYFNAGLHSPELGSPEMVMELAYRLASFRIEIAEKAFAAGGVDYPAGSWILSEQKGLVDVLRSAAAELAVDFAGAPAVPDVSRHESRLPRLAVWHTWADTEAVGWVRLILDRQKIPYAHLQVFPTWRVSSIWARFMWPSSYERISSFICSSEKRPWMCVMVSSWRRTIAQVFTFQP